MNHQPTLGEEIGAPTDLNVDTSELFHALASPRRRYVVARLCEAADTHPLDELAFEVAAWELGCGPASVSKETEEHVFTSLYHNHAPKLANAGLVEFDPDELTVEISDVGAELEGRKFLPTIK